HSEGTPSPILRRTLPCIPTEKPRKHRGPFSLPVPRRPHPWLPGPRPHSGRAFPSATSRRFILCASICKGIPSLYPPEFVCTFHVLGHDGFACSCAPGPACFRSPRVPAEDVRLRRSAANRSFA